MRKKLFAVIMSAMMMITFMPAMAFATENATVDTGAGAVVWDTTSFGSAQVKTNKGIVTVAATKTFDSSTGKTTALLGGAGISGTTAYNLIWGSVDNDQDFYDLTNAKIVRAISGTEVLAKVNADDYFGMIDQSIVWKTPLFNESNTIFNLFGYNATPANNEAYVKVFDPTATSSPASYLVSAADIISNADFEQVLPKYEKYQASQNYDVTGVKATVKSTATTPIINGDKMVNAYSVYIDSSSFSKLGLKFEGSSVEYEVDLKDTLALATISSTPYDTTYTGTAQKVDVLTKGLTVQYSVDNGTTWTDAAPEIKDQKATGYYEFAVKVTNDKNVSKYGKVKVNVSPVKGRIEFKKSNFNFAPKTAIKASDLVQYVPYENLEPIVETKKVAMTDEDKAMAKEFIDKFVVIKDLDLDNPVNKNVYFVIDKDAVEKAYKTDEKVYNFIKNFGNFANPNYVKVISGENADVNFGLQYNDITAPNKVVTYKAKKGKLAKTKTYTLKATADFGTLSFTKMNTKGGSKIKVAKSGKVTIKKGLKKGTYKVKVKVKAPGTKANMYLTVKVK